MPAMPKCKGVREGILKGMYKFKAAEMKEKTKLHAQLLGSGAIMTEVLAAAGLLAAEGVRSAVWSVTSYNELARDAQLSGDRVAAENFQQHAEHYLRLLSAGGRHRFGLVASPPQAYASSIDVRGELMSVGGGTCSRMRASCREMSKPAPGRCSWPPISTSR